MSSADQCKNYRGDGRISPTAVVDPYNTRRQSLGASVSFPTTFLLVRPLGADLCSYAVIFLVHSYIVHVKF